MLTTYRIVAVAPALDLACVCRNVAWTSYVCHSVYNLNVDGADVRYRRNAQLWTRVLHYRNALGEN